MPITVKHRAADSGQALSRAAYGAGAADWWDRLARSGMTAAQLYEGRTRQERGIEAQAAAQERAAAIRDDERAELRGVREDRERQLARAAMVETGMEPAPGEGDIGYLQRAQPEMDPGRKDERAKELRQRERADLQKQLAVVKKYPGLEESERAVQIKRLERALLEVPPEEEEQPPNPEEMYQRSTYVDPQSGATIGFDPQTGKPFKLVDAPKPEAGAAPKFGDFNKEMDTATKFLQAAAQAAVAGTTNVPKAVTQEDAFKLVQERRKLFGRIGEDPDIERKAQQEYNAALQAREEELALGVEAGGGAPEVEPPVGAEAGVPPAPGVGVQDTGPKRVWFSPPPQPEYGLPGDPETIRKETVRVEQLRQKREQADLARIANDPKYMAQRKKYKAQGMSADRISLMLRMQLASEDEGDTLTQTGTPQEYAAWRAEHNKQFGE